jgi:hypothetical protein
MADEIKYKFKQATLYLSRGEKEKAKQLFLEILKNTKNTGQKLNAVLGLLDSLSPVEELDDLLSYCNEGLSLANAIPDRGMVALIKARKAVFLQNKSSHFIYERDCLKLSREWVGFSLETEKQQYEFLDNKINIYEKDIEELFNQALEVAENLGDLDLQGRILMMQGDLLGSEFLHKSMVLVQKKSIFKTKLFNMHWLKLLGLDKYLVYNWAERKQLRQIIKNCEDKFLQSAKCFYKAGNENTAGYSYYNLVIPLNSAYKFRRAWGYLNIAKKIAEKYNDVSLMRSVKDMGLSLQQKNSQYYQKD